MPYCEAFFGLAVQDKACFHATLSHYSAMYCSQHQEDSTEESILHFMAAIKMITERLGHPELGCSDGTIAAVSCLMIYEVLFVPQ